MITLTELKEPLFVQYCFLCRFPPHPLFNNPHVSGCHYFFLICSSWKATTSYAEQNCIPDIGTKVMGWFPEQEQWCRAQVTKICGISGGGFSSVYWDGFADAHL